MGVEQNDAIRFGFLVQDVARLRRIAGDRALRSLGVTRAQWWVLTFLSRRDGMTQTALAADLDLTKVAIGGLLTRMEAANLVERRSSAQDGRVRRVHLTRTGNELVGQIRKQIRPFELETLSMSSDKDLEVALVTLRRMKKRLLGMIGEAREPDSVAEMDEAETA